MSAKANDQPLIFAPLVAHPDLQHFVQGPPPLLSSAPVISSSSLPAPESSQYAPHTYGTRTRQNSVLKPSIRALYSQNTPLSPASSAVPPSPHAPSASTLAPSVKKEQRRIRPIAACASPSTSSDSKQSTATLKGILKGGKDAGRKPPPQTTPAPLIEFPPAHVVLHPDDASSKVFQAMGRAFMSVGNRAMTVKDLAELTLKQGLVCQNASAAAQAITSFIRSHLHRCEVELDFPLLLRHVLSGTPRDDALVPALHSKLGGNVTNHKAGSSAAANSSKSSSGAASEQENQEKPQERLTSFRRGTTVWYLSRAAGAPCPFASAGIALRDYSECSGITGAESRRTAGSSATNAHSGGGSGTANWTDEEDEDEGESEGRCRGLKRKRAGLRTRNASGVVVTKNAEPAVVDEDVREGRKPPKFKLTLKLRPPQSCLSVVSRPPVREDESASSESSSEESDSDDDSDDGDMEVDIVSESAPEQQKSQPLQMQTCDVPEPFEFPPFPCQRRISIPPYTPSAEQFSATSSSYWSHPMPSSTNGNFEVYTPGKREVSVPLSVGSPPPESDDEDLDIDEGDEEETSPGLNFVKKEEEVPFKFEWPVESSFSSSPSSALPAAEAVKSEEFGHNMLGMDIDDLGFSSLNLGLDNIKIEEDSDDLAATYMRALASVLPSDVDAEMPENDMFGVEPVVHRANVAIAAAPMSGWRDDCAINMAVPMTEPDFEGDWTGAEAAEDFYTMWESHASASGGPSTSERLADADALAQSQSPGVDDDDESEERASSPALTYAASSPGDSSSDAHDEDDENNDEHDSAGDQLNIGVESVSSVPAVLTSVPAHLLGSDLREECNLSRSRRNSPSPSTLSLSLSRTRTNSVNGKPRIPLSPSSSSVVSLQQQQQRPPTIADAADFDAVDAGSAPWERGMLTVADVEAHLLPALSPTYEYPVPGMTPFAGAASHFSFGVQGESTLTSPPLSPQEKEMFQNFCMFDGDLSDPEPDTGDSGDDVPAKEKVVVVPEIAKRTTTILETTNSVKGKETDVTEEPSKPLRRSRRVANAVASQQTAAARAKLRKRN